MNMFHIYGKHETQKRFRPMDLREGVQVTNRVRATRNPDWQFEARPI